MNTCYAAKPRLTILMAALGTLSALPAHALVIDGLSGQATTQVEVNAAVNQGPLTSPTSVFVDVNDNGVTSSGAARATGYAPGAYFASAGGDGVFDSTARFIRTWDITNDSGVAQNYSFTFYIYDGRMSARDLTLGGAGSGYAEYAIDIVRDGVTSLFSSTAKIAHDGTLTTTGTVLNGASNGSVGYSWGGTYVTVNLGILNAGQSTSVAYDLVSHAVGNYGLGTCVDGDHPITYGGQCTGFSSVIVGDPNQLNATPIPGIGIIAANAVPEPGTLGLLGLGGLAVLGLRRRRHP